jgi:hypothetical protein
VGLALSSGPQKHSLIPWVRVQALHISALASLNYFHIFYTFITHKNVENSANGTIHVVLTRQHFACATLESCLLTCPHRTLQVKEKAIDKPTGQDAEDKKRLKDFEGMCLDSVFFVGIFNSPHYSLFCLQKLFNLSSEA